MDYTLLDLTSAVQDDLHDPSFSATRIRRYLNHGQLAIFNTHSFKFTEKTVEGTLTVGEYTFNQQSDHQVTIGGVLTDPTTSGRRFVFDEENYMPHREFFDQFPDPSLEPQALPRYWTEFGTQLYFSCPVDKAYVFRQRYYRIPTSMTADGDVPDVPETFREVLEFYALYRSEKYRGNQDVAAVYKQDYEDGLEAMNIRYAGVHQVGAHKMRQTRTRAHD